MVSKMAYEDLVEIDQKLHADYELSLRDDELVFSQNNKCAYSIDLPVARTCRPTSVCAEYCYGCLENRFHADRLTVLRKHLRVLRYMSESDPLQAADRIVKEYKAKHMQCLRWCGVGDLTMEVVRVVNTIAVHHPEVIQWVVSRKPDLLAQIVRGAPCVRMMLSLDSSAESMAARAEIGRHQIPNLKLSYLRVHPEEDVLGAHVVYDLHPGYPPPPSPAFVCPADSGHFPSKKWACLRPQGPDQSDARSGRCGWRCTR